MTAPWRKACRRPAGSRASARGRVDTEALEAMARALLGNGQFEETEEDIPQMLEEFYPEAETENPPAQTSDMASPATAAVKPNPPRPSVSPD